MISPDIDFNVNPSFNVPVVFIFIGTIFPSLISIVPSTHFSDNFTPITSLSFSSTGDIIKSLTIVFDALLSSPCATTLVTFLTNDLGPETTTVLGLNTGVAT